MLCYHQNHRMTELKNFCSPSPSSFTVWKQTERENLLKNTAPHWGGWVTFTLGLVTFPLTLATSTLVASYTASSGRPQAWMGIKKTRMENR